MSDTTGGPASTAPQKTLRDHLNDEKTRAVLYQLLAAFAVIALFTYMVSNVTDNLASQNIQTGYDFLNLEAAFGISESPINYDASDTYGRALFVGFLNTFKVSLTGIVLTSVIGVLVGIARLSSNWLVAKMSAVYVEVLRNIPVLLQLTFWYAVIGNALPHPRRALEPIPNVLFTNRGVYAPIPEADIAFGFMLIAALLAVPVIVTVKRRAARRQAETGAPFPMLRTGCVLFVGMICAAYLIGGAPTAVSYPELKGFNIRGGIRVTPEFLALLTGLTVYTSAFVAEAVRAGILAVPAGQWEAAESLGLRRSVYMRKIILPQAMRVAVPPITNQYLNLTKNSSLAVAIGYPDLVSIGNTTLSQTGQAIEAISVFMTVYLALSLVTSLFMNRFNDKMKLVER